MVQIADANTLALTLCSGSYWQHAGPFWSVPSTQTGDCTHAPCGFGSFDFLLWSNLQGSLSRCWRTDRLDASIEVGQQHLTEVTAKDFAETGRIASSVLAWIKRTEACSKWVAAYSCRAASNTETPTRSLSGLNGLLGEHFHPISMRNTERKFSSSQKSYQGEFRQSYLR